jgi:hypothetical protein
MVTYVDTQSGGVNNDLTEGGTFEWSLNLGTKFWLNAANNLIRGQLTGQSVTFKIQDIRGSETVTVAYGQSVSRQVVGHLVTTVPPTLPASPNADIQIVLSDQETDLAVNTVGQTPIGGDTTDVVSAQLTPAGVILYTAPANIRSFLTKGTLVNNSTTTGDTAKVFIFDSVHFNFRLANITPFAGESVPKLSDITVGPNANDDVVIANQQPIHPGQVLWGQSAAGLVYGTFSILQEPL